MTLILPLTKLSLVMEKRSTNASRIPEFYDCPRTGLNVNESSSLREGYKAVDIGALFEIIPAVGLLHCAYYIKFVHLWIFHLLLTTAN